MRKSQPCSATFKGTFVWSMLEQGWLVSALFCASLLTVSISGRLADRFDAKKLLVGGLSVYALLTAMSPLMASASFMAFLSTRFAMGLVDVS